MKRTIELTFMDGFEQNEHNDNAIGYLVRWGMGERHSNVKICGIGQGHDADCLFATYTDGNGKITYELFAHRSDDGTFSFHS